MVRCGTVGVGRLGATSAVEPWEFVVHLVTRRVAVALAMAAIAFVAGCTAAAGRSGSASTSENPNSPDATIVAMIACFRAHGLPAFPDAVFDPDDGRWHLANERPNITPQVEQACASVIPHSTPAKAIPSGQLHDLLNYAKCMRAHGMPDFPDPAVDGVFHGVESNLKTDPVAQSANTACQQFLASSGGNLQVGN